MDQKPDEVALLRSTVSDMAAKIKRLEDAKQARPATRQAATGVQAVFLPSRVTLASGGGSMVSTWTAAKVGARVPAGATEALCDFYVVTGESRMDISVSPDGVRWVYACRGQSDAGPSGKVGVGNPFWVPLGPSGDFFYKVTGPATTSWDSWQINLAGYR